MPKLTRKTIEEGLQTVPIESLLLGASKEKNRLTAKQRKFAEGLAMGKSKAAAYRDAYDSTGKPETQSRRGQELAQHSLIQAQVDALIMAEEARKHATPAALRALVIERLTRHALDDDIPPAQRLRALELLGKVTEVAAFTERREVVTHTDPGAARERLLSTLRLALQSGATDAHSLLAEIRPAQDAAVIDAQAPNAQEAPPGDHTAPPPARSLAGAPDAALHSIPHPESPDFSIHTPPPQSGEPPPMESHTSSDGTGDISKGLPSV